MSDDPPRKRAEIQCNVSQILEAITDNMALIGNDFSVLAANEPTIKHYGIPRDELIGRRCFDAFQGRMTPCAGCPVEVTRRTRQPYRLEVQAATTGAWLEINTTPIFADDSSLIGVLEHARDVTAHHSTAPVDGPHLQLLNQLLVERAHLREILRQAPAGLVVVDATGRIVLSNGQVEEIFGTPCGPLDPATDIPTSTLSLDGRLVAIEDAPLSRALREGTSTSQEFEFQRPDGASGVVHISASPVWDRQGLIVAAVETIRDVTAQARSRSELLRAQIDLRALLLSLPLGVGMHRDGRWIWANPELARSLGIQGSEALIGQPIEAGFHREDVARLLTLAGAGRTEQAPVPMRFHRGEEVLTLEVVAGPRIDFEGAQAAILILQDVTEQASRQSQLQVASRMLSLGTLAAGAAHQMNNPLAYLISSIDFIASAQAFRDAALAGDSELAEALAEAREGAQRLAGIVTDLQTFAGSAGGPGTATDVWQVLEGCLRIAESELRMKAVVQRDPRPVRPAAASSAQLSQVFLNLLVNAAQSIEAGHPEANCIRVSVHPGAEGRVIVEFSDTGCGIPAENLGRVFEPFFTTKGPGAAGLGLSVCHGIVGGLGGALSVESVPGQGSTFRVDLPAAAGLERAPSPVPTTPLPATQLRILIIDDNQSVLYGLARLLEAHHVTTCSNGDDALGLLLGKSTHDVVLCDLMMPGTSGIDIYRRVKAERPALAARFILTTGGAYTQDAENFLAEVPNPVLYKPFSREALEALIGQLGAIDRGTPVPD